MEYRLALAVVRQYKAIMGLFSNDVSDDVAVSATFPESNPFGLVVNGEQNGLLLHLENHGSKNYTLVSAAASYHDVTNHWRLVKNTTALKYNVPLVAGSNFSAPFSMYSEFRPQEIGLTVWVNLAETGTRDIFPVTALNQTVSVVEPPASWFDAQLIFLYLVITAALAGGAYAAYNTFFNQSTKKRSGKGGQQRKVKAVVPADPKDQAYPNVKPYEEDWIPQHHLKSKSAKVKKADGATSGEEATSGGEATSGAESGPEGARRRKNKGKRA